MKVGQNIGLGRKHKICELFTSFSQTLKALFSRSVCFFNTKQTPTKFRRLSPCRTEATEQANKHFQQAQVASMRTPNQKHGKALAQSELDGQSSSSSSRKTKTKKKKMKRTDESEEEKHFLLLHVPWLSHSVRQRDAFPRARAMEYDPFNSYIKLGERAQAETRHTSVQSKQVQLQPQFACLHHLVGRRRCRFNVNANKGKQTNERRGRRRKDQTLSQYYRSKSTEEEPASTNIDPRLFSLMRRFSFQAQAFKKNQK